MPPELIGTWTIDPSDADALRRFGRVSMRFEAQGRLVYMVHGKEKVQGMNLTYRVDGEFLVTDQPSSRREERTKFSIAADGLLELDYGSAVMRLRRQ